MLSTIIFWTLTSALVGGIIILIMKFGFELGRNLGHREAEADRNNNTMSAQ